MRSTLTATVCVALCSASLAFAQLPPPPSPPSPPAPADPTPIELTVSGNVVRGTIELPGGIGAELTISFESVVGLTPTALEASACLVNPLDPNCSPTLPGAVSVPAAFPVLLRIRPSASSALSFSGLYTISLHTFNLELDPLVPLALYKAPDGGTFQDITRAEGRGSYRDDGGGGDFSDFIIVIDSNPIDTVIVAKFDALQALLGDSAGSMPPDVFSELQSRLSQARTLYQSGSPKGAIGLLTAFAQYVKAHSGQDIPDVWRAHDPGRVNVAGLLRSGADTLKFSLDRKASH